jgi:hypothetical protein
MGKPPLRMASAAECTRFERDTFADLYTLMAALDETASAEIWLEIEVALTQFESADGFTAPCEVTVGVGTRAG